MEHPAGKTEESLANLRTYVGGVGGENSTNNPADGDLAFDGADEGD